MRLSISEGDYSQTIITPLIAARVTKVICTTTDPAALAPPPTVAGTLVLELDVDLDEVRVVDERVVEVSWSLGESREMF